jgi:predicted phosphoribosyltransferase
MSKQSRNTTTVSIPVWTKEVIDRIRKESEKRGMAAPGYSAISEIAFQRFFNITKEDIEKLTPEQIAEIAVDNYFK